MFVYHEGKKALLDTFILEKSAYYENQLYLISMAGPESAVQGIKAAILNRRTVTIEMEDHTYNACLTHYGSTACKMKKLPSGYIHALIYSKHYFCNKPSTQIFIYSRSLIIFGDTENECLDIFARYLKHITVPVHRNWIETLWRLMEKKELIMPQKKAYLISLSHEQISSLVLENLSQLKKLM